MDNGYILYRHHGIKVCTLTVAITFCVSVSFDKAGSELINTVNTKYTQHTHSWRIYSQQKHFKRLPRSFYCRYGVYTYKQYDYIESRVN